MATLQRARLRQLARQLAALGSTAAAASPSCLRQQLLAVDGLGSAPRQPLARLARAIAAVPAAAVAAAAPIAALGAALEAAVSGNNQPQQQPAAAAAALQARSAALLASLAAVYGRAALAGDAATCRTLAEQASAPLHAALLASRRAAALGLAGGHGVHRVDLSAVAAEAAADVGALAIEKHGAAPPVEITGAAVCVGSSGPVAHAVMEVLKNAVGGFWCG